MPNNKSALIRHRIIDRCLNDKKHRFPTKEYLAEKCTESLRKLTVKKNMDGNLLSISTIEKDIATMRKNYPVGYDAPIVYAKNEKGYVYSEEGFTINNFQLSNEEWEALQFSAHLLFQYSEVPIFSNFKDAINRINTRFSLDMDIDSASNNCVSFEMPYANVGQEWIAIIYKSIIENFSIQFSYENIYKKQIKTYQLIPYLLKEHRNRWYVIGWNEGRKDYLIFALDRIHSLQTLEIETKKKSDFHNDSFFKHATGIMQSAEEPLEVEISLKAPISTLVLLEPLHHSQQLIEEAIDEIRIKLTVFVNEELCLRLLGLGPCCVVLKPISLKEKIKSMVNTMHKAYQ
jgi:predicted DNA-binding transcriptional regulator YafY